MIAVTAVLAVATILGGGTWGAWVLAHRTPEDAPQAPPGGWQKWDDDEDEWEK